MSFGNPNIYHDDAQACLAEEGRDAWNSIFALLRSRNIAPVVSAGNEGGDPPGGQENMVLANACLPEAIAISSSRRDDTMAYYSNAGPLTSLLAPGGDQEVGGDGGIVVALPGSTIGPVQGTSFAAPLVAGAWAVMRQKSPTLTVPTVLRILQETGADVAEDRAGYTPITHKRLQLDSALTALDGMPEMVSLTVLNSGTINDGDEVDIAIVANNATDCEANGTSSSTSLSDGEGVISLTAIAGDQAYVIECSDASGYSAQMSVLFSATGSSTPPESPPEVEDGTIISTPLDSIDAPDTGFALLFANPFTALIGSALSAGAIVFISRRSI